MHKFWSEKIGEAGEEALLEQRELEHVFKTLRFRSGDELILLDGKGKEALAEVGSGRSIRIKSVCHGEPDACRISLFCAAPKRQKLDVLLKQAVELGAAEVRFLSCRYSVAQPENMERMTNLLIEGCKQSGNLWMPELKELTPFGDLPEIFAAMRADVYYGDVATGGNYPRVKGKNLVWMVGPEGGFAPEELAQLKLWGAEGLNLGGNILRLETAAAAGIAVLRCLNTLQY